MTDPISLQNAPIGAFFLAVTFLEALHAGGK